MGMGMGTGVDMDLDMGVGVDLDLGQEPVKRTIRTINGRGQWQEGCDSGRGRSGRNVQIRGRKFNPANIGQSQHGDGKRLTPQQDMQHPAPAV